MQLAPCSFRLTVLRALTAACLALGAASCAGPSGGVAALGDLGAAVTPTVSPRARAVSQPVPVNKVNDAAIWVHPTDPAKSLLLISNEMRGLELHEPDGALLKLYDDGDLRPNNVDLLYGFALARPAPAGGAVSPAPETVDLAVVLTQGARTAGIRLLRIDPDKRRVQDVTAGGLIEVFDGAPPAGLCAYHSRRTGRAYVFVTSKSGTVEQHELIADADGRIGAKRVRALKLESKVKYAVADDERGAVYLGEEKAGVWRFAAEPDAAAPGKLVIRVGEHGLVPDVVGMAVYGAAGGRGYLIVVSQGPRGGNSSLKVYRRDGDNEFVLSIDPSPDGFGPLDRVSGVAVTNRPAGPAFPKGLLVANDRINPNASEDFKLFAWEDVAGPGGLITDTAWSPRP